MPAACSSASHDVALLLEAHGIRATSARIAIMAVLLDTPVPASIASIHARLPSNQRQLSQAAVYRAAAAFAQAGLVVRGWDGTGIGRMVYVCAPVRQPPARFRFTCRCCGRGIDIADELFSQQFYHQAVRAGFDRDLTSVCIWIECNHCVAPPANPPDQ